MISKGASTRNIKSLLSENVGGILGGSQCEMGDCLILNGCYCNIKIFMINRFRS
jgi:hypothetical protein